MPTIQVVPGSVELQAIADTLGKSRKVVVVTGAGISTNCGIPDFRSENGLYSLIQAQFDAAVENPPWEETNTHDIDDRPKKRRKPWYFYEVVAPGGQVVDTVGGGLSEDSKAAADASTSISIPNRSSRSHSASVTTKPPTNTQGNPSDSSDLSDPPSDLDEAPWSSDNSKATQRALFENQDLPKLRSGSPTHSHTQSNLSDSSDLSDPPSDLGEAPWTDSDSRYPLVNQTPRSHPDSRSQTRPNSPNQPSDSSKLSDLPSGTSEALWITSGTQVVTPRADPPRIQNPRRSLRRNPDLFTNSTSIDALDSRLELLQPPSAAYGNTTSSFNTSSINTTTSSDAPVYNTNPPPQRRSRSRSFTPPRQFLPPVSSPRLPETQPAPSSRSIQALRREESSFVSNNSEEAEPSTQSSQVSRTSLPNLKGRDLFDSMVWSDARSTSIFYMFISSLRQKIHEVKDTTETHKFIKVLRDGGRLVRNYTQNIDCLEEREGLSTEISSGPGNRSRFTPKSQREPRPAEISRDSAQFGGVEVVLLHGDLGALRCGLCSRLSEWDAERGSITIEGRAPDCPSCLEAHAKRTRGGRRGLAVGRLRPNIVLYGEEHPQAALVSPLVTHDLGLGPDVLLIMGTSLRVHGLKVMVREFAKAIHAKGGKVVFVNRTKPSESVWGEVIDYWVEWDCDAWVVDLRERRGDIWLPQGSVEDRRESIGDVKARRGGDLDPTQPKKKKFEAPRCTRDEKTNGVYFTFKIMDTLRSLEDKDGQSIRRQYWVSRSSTGSANTKSKTTEADIPSVKGPSKKSGAASSTIKAPRKSLPDKPQHMKTALPNSIQSSKAAPRSNKRKSMLAPAPPTAISEDQTRVNYELTKKATWHELQTNNPSLLTSSPPEVSPAILQRPANIPWLKAKDYWKAFPTLVTHPPSGASCPIHTPSRAPPQTTASAPAARPPPNHSYGTRASRTDTSAAMATMDGMTQPLKPFGQRMTVHASIESRIPTPPESDPQTPVTNRDMSVGAMLSSEKDDNDSFKSVMSSVRESTTDSVDMLAGEKDGNESFNSAKDQSIKWHDAVMEQ